MNKTRKTPQATPNYQKLLLALVLAALLVLTIPAFTHASEEELFTVNYYDGATLIESVQRPSGSAVIAGPAKAGMTFGGWYTQTSGGVRVTRITEDIDLYGRYSPKTYKIKYMDGSKVLLNSTRNFNTTLPSSPAPAKVGKRFIGWYSASSGGSQITRMPAKNVTVYARYENIRYSVKYYDDSGNLIRTSSQLHNANVIAGPPKTGHTFVGWYTAKSGGTKITKITANRNLHARYQVRSYNISYRDGSKVLVNSKRNFNATIPTGHAPTKTGKKFIGWYSAQTGGTQIKRMPAKNINVWARYENIRYEVKYYTDSGALHRTSNQLHNANVIAGPPKEGHTFTGWFTAKTGGTKVTKIDRKRNLHARYAINNYTITYYDEDNKLLSSAKRNFNATIPTGHAPTKTGKTFIGWYSARSGGTQVTRMPAKNQNVWARYTPLTYTVDYWVDGSLHQSATAAHGSTVIAGPLHPDGHPFEGWFTAASGGTRVTTITANRTLYARYTAPKMYGVVFYEPPVLLDEYPSPAHIPTAIFMYDLVLPIGGNLPDGPPKPGLTFRGWYTIDESADAKRSYGECNTCGYTTIPALMTAHRQIIGPCFGSSVTGHTPNLYVGPNSIKMTHVDGNMVLYALYE